MGCSPREIKHGLERNKEYVSPTNSSGIEVTSILGDTVIHSDDIAWLQTEIKEPMIGLDMIEILDMGKYQEGSTYLLVADVVRGDGADNSVFHVLNVGKMK